MFSFDTYILLTPHRIYFPLINLLFYVHPSNLISNMTCSHDIEGEEIATYCGLKNNGCVSFMDLTQ
jgi:hypothetical protein